MFAVSWIALYVRAPPTHTHTHEVWQILGGPLPCRNCSHPPNTDLEQETVPLSHVGTWDLSSQNPNLGDVTWNTEGTREKKCWLFGAIIVLCWRSLCRKGYEFSCPGTFWHICVFNLDTLQKPLGTGAGPGSARGIWGPGSQQFRDKVLSPPKLWRGQTLPTPQYKVKPF